ncbi:hypothetical protein PAXRUDRAFT_832374 [Paxillus rubicundulus Ve08.2h10]|uniref:Uncharacterized protein n=1 Tax=Paxillus rubicundulus Ve08.2h10 TaxID=930991 RepID=A0A0D0CHH3_9AGAM|nr:hypothetical protein PAXRUDRAFT_832374 [Paxillus rubicundulus Ve08.2h10]
MERNYLLNFVLVHLSDALYRILYLWLGVPPYNQNCLITAPPYLCADPKFGSFFAPSLSPSSQTPVAKAFYYQRVLSLA